MEFKINGKIVHSVEELCSEVTPEFAKFVSEWFSDSDYMIAQTSGSTGTPKTIQLLKSDMRASARMTNAFFNINQTSTFLLSLSPNYIAGKMMIVRWLEAGAEMIEQKPSSNPLQQPLQSRITLSAMVPSQVINVLNDTVSLQQLSKIDNIIIGGAPLDFATEKQISETSVNAYATYGMTETLSHVALRKIGADKEYFALNGVTFEQDSRECLVINVPHLSVKRLVTNDIVTLTDNTHFIWRGRYDNVINSGGVKIFPEEIEKLIEPYISQRFYIIGTPDTVWGEVCTLVIEGEEWSREKQQNLLAQLKGVLPKHKAPKQIKFLPQFAETISGKVKRVVCFN
ncbi:MAG: AMP-dependent synthetase [Bacteroidales bacterium]|nr:AMP-dependent synthetase [Bacteroidales bacterium]